MDLAERVRLPTVAEAHRYELAAVFANGRRVLHVGSPDAAAGLEDVAAEVRHVSTLDAHAARGYELIVWLDGLQDEPDPEAASALLEQLSARGTALMIGIPNATVDAPDTQSPRAVWTAGVVRDLAERLDGAIVIAQYLAEGSLIVPPGDHETPEASGLLPDRAEPAYADRLIVVADPGREALARTTARMQLAVAANFNRWMAETARANRELRAANAALRRDHLGRSDSAAGTYVARVDRLLQEAEAERDAALREARRHEEEMSAQYQRAEILELRLRTLRNRKVVRAGLQVGRLNPRTWFAR